MVEIVIGENSVLMEGHAITAKGIKDTTVCEGFSAISQIGIMAMQKLTEYFPYTEQKSGRFYIKMEDDAPEAAKLMFGMIKEELVIYAGIYKEYAIIAKENG